MYVYIHDFKYKYNVRNSSSQSSDVKQSVNFV